MENKTMTKANETLGTILAKALLEDDIKKATKAELQEMVQAGRNRINQLEQNARNRERLNIGSTITEHMANLSEVVRDRDWTQQDTLRFHRVKLFEKMLDQLSWSHRQAEEYADKQKERVAQAQRRFTGDELSTFQLQAAIAEAKSAALNVEIIAQTFDSVEAHRWDATGEAYTPYGTSKRSNIAPQRAQAQMPADIAADLAALGLAPTAPANRNTDGEEDRTATA